MEFLGDGLVMEQPPDAFHLTGDAVALAKFFSCKPTDTVIDIGCGTGVLSLLVSKRCARVYAVDINENAVKQAAENVRMNNLSNIHILTADIRTAHGEIGANTADAVICNPPYFESGEMSQNANKRMARHNETLSLADLAAAATRLLKCGGHIFFCYPAFHTAKAVAIFENNNFRVKELKFISNTKGVYLTLFKCKKYNGGTGHNTKITV
jgi:tRNA1Val (adenine37-N6)-methyltransferase